jgi:hypothetical protein
MYQKILRDGDVPWQPSVSAVAGFYEKLKIMKTATNIPASTNGAQRDSRGTGGAGNSPADPTIRHSTIDDENEEGYSAGGADNSSSSKQRRRCQQYVSVASLLAANNTSDYYRIAVGLATDR